MLEYFGRKSKQHKEEKAKEEKAKGDKIREEKGKAPEAPPDEVLAPEDEEFLRALISAEGPAPPLPPRTDIVWESSSDLHVSAENSPAGSGDEGEATATAAAAAAPQDEEATGKKEKKTKTKRSRLAILPFFKKKDHDSAATLAPADVSPAEEAREEKDLSRILSTLSLAAHGDRAVSLTPDVSALSRRFTLILKDLANGVPTAYGDLVGLIEDRDGLLERTFEKLPSSLQKLVMQMPDKVTASIAPEVLAAAAKAQGVEVAAEAGLKEAAMSLMTVKGLKEMVTKPGAVAGMLRSIVNALKLRFPAFLGTNVLWSVAVFLLLFVLWYCYKRGKEERLKQEAAAKEVRDGDDLSVEEVLDEPREPVRLDGPNPVPVITEPEESTAGGSSHQTQK
ncbi:uncharacterized protein DNG_01198 [Cephalotrichum gorgonifer]|uniref:Ring-like domain-containing protein n=1 Tax=Cephalotrichum gorgonifer TaxID=2041049 RepID=A0AAE8MQ28_9PEZI|nr:uncharacterized protein DNG_01198 [Cephalotrichum gorgonifer]